MVYPKTVLRRLFDTAFELNAGLPDDYQQAVYAEGLRCLRLPALQANRGRRKVLLVGGAGYIGSVVSARLLNAGYQVCCFDRLLYDNQVCVLPHCADPGYRFVYGDLCDPAAADAALSGCTDVVILAGLVGDPITKRYPDAAQHINHDGMLRLLDALQGRGLNKVVFISTCSNYGLIESDRLADESFELKPLSLYAKAKVAMEQALLERAAAVDYCPTVLRFATAFGLSPRMRFDLTVNEFTRELCSGRELLVFDAETWRPYCHVQDFALLIGRVLEAPLERVAGQVFNAGGEANNCTKQLIVDKLLERLPGAAVRYQAQGPDPRNYRVSFEKVKTALHFQPAYDIDAGIDELLGALRQRLFEGVEQRRNFYGNYQIDYTPGSAAAARPV